MPGTLFVVATPIGNLGDLTLRAIETLKAVSLVVAEDSRRTRALLSHLGISKSIATVNAHASDHDLEKVTRALEGGSDVALVTDAGTPAVSDPGTALVARAIALGVRVVPIPGASALLSALCASGIATDAGFRFFAFLPRDGRERAEVLTTVAQTPEPCVIYESPNRVHSTLIDLARAEPKRECVVARELTKMHEEFLRGALGALAKDEREWIGEVVIVLGKTEKKAESAIDDEAVTARIDEELALGAHAKVIAERLAAWSGRPKREIYERVVRRKQERE
jgi:16S rRNA (cytidine1402-2'-O)-methyltransferase